MHNYHSKHSGRFYKTEFGACLGELWNGLIKEPWGKGEYFVSVFFFLGAPLLLSHPDSRQIVHNASKLEKISPNYQVVS
jgi:hypothetical protein